MIELNFYISKIESGLNSFALMLYTTANGFCSYGTLVVTDAITLKSSAPSYCFKKY